MAEFKHKENTGSLFKNDRKESDRHPDYKGAALVGGQDFWLSAWVNESKDGRKYLSVKFTSKDGAQGRAAPTRQAAQPDDDLSFGDDAADDIPF